MKILRLRLKNLNSFKGEHELNLCEEPFQSAGLFAIVGNTGAGKTSLLDAITLALYGKMARYQQFESPMNRGCSDCSAEVEFETGLGIFRATWSQKKSGGKHEFASPVRFVYDAEGNPIAEKIRPANDKIEELTGLDYTRFLRCAMLAQGDFDKFLTAEPNERSELLERVTGTDIYSRLGKLSFEQHRAMKSKVESLQTQLEGIELLSEKQLKEKQDELSDLSRKQKDLETKRDSEQEVYGKIETLKNARIVLSASRATIGQIDQKLSEREPEFKKLKRHLECQPLVEAVTSFRAAKNSFEAAKEEYENSQKRAKETQEARDLSTLVLRACLDEEIPSLEERLKGLAGSIKKNEGSLETCRKWLEKHKEDEELTKSLSVLLEQNGKLKLSRRVFSGAVEGLEEKAGALLGEQQAGPDMEDLPDIPSMKIATEELFAKIDERTSIFSAAKVDAQKEFVLKDDHLKKARQLAALSQHMHLLEEGKPCPMCGSPEHPDPNPTDDGGGLEIIESARNDSEEALNQSKEALKGMVDGRSEIKKIVDGCSEALEEKLDADKKLKDALEPYGLPLPVPGKEDSLSTALGERETEFKNQVSNQKNLKLQIQEEGLSVVPLQAELEGLIEQREALPLVERNGEELPEDLPKIIAAKNDYGTAKTNAENAAISSVGAKERTDNLKSPFDMARNEMNRGLAASSFATVEEWDEARLPEEEAGQLRRGKDKLETSRSVETGKIETASKTIGKLEKENIPEGKEAQSFLEAFKKRNEDISGISSQVGASQQIINQQNENKRNWQKKAKELGRNESVLQDWARLNEIIGCSTGNKFRTLAQSLTLDMLVSLANRHLEGLEPRYRLERDENERKKLGLLIRDEHEGGVTRLVSSLSGGETFLVSLALALGVSDLARGKTRIDTLFIDEGFGSLDSGCLEKAIGVLQNLIHQNKTVGVISHVELLKERITTQVEIEILPGGKRKLNLKSGTTG